MGELPIWPNVQHQEMVTALQVEQQTVQHVVIVAILGVTEDIVATVHPLIPPRLVEVTVVGSAKVVSRSGHDPVHLYFIHLQKYDL